MKRKIGSLLAALLLVVTCDCSAFAMPKVLVPGGCTVGMKLYCEGLVVTGFEKPSAARIAGLKTGDVIVRADGKSVTTAASLRSCLGREQVVLTVLRNGKEAEYCVRPQEEKLGVYIRDSISGIGTVTYYDPETGSFGALGHGVSEAETELVIPVNRGTVIRSRVERVEKGEQGDPGELKGRFDVNQILGEVEKNTMRGVFGRMSEEIKGAPVSVASAGDVRIGAAEIRSNVSGTQVESYSVEILKIYPHAEETGRNLLLQITDPRLLEQTGGIVQGMSGSPIIQDGKLVGAVTHVLVNDPTKGYGIFIQNMLDAAG